MAAVDVENDSSPGKSVLVKTEGEMYMESLVRVSLLLVSEEFPLEAQLHGSKMLQHLVDHRSGELSGADLLNLKIQLVRCPSERVVSLNSMTNEGKPKEHSKHNKSLVVIAAKNSLRSQKGSNPSGPTIFFSSVKRALAFGDERVDLSLLLDPDFMSGPNHSISCWSSESGNSSSPEKSDRSSSGSGKLSQNSNNSMSVTASKDGLLLTEHNILCEAFGITTSVFGIAEYAKIIPCLFDPLNKIWALVKWDKNDVSGVFGLTNLLSDGHFLKMAYHVVKFSEEQLTSRKVKEYDATDLFTVAVLQPILPFLLQLLHCIHALWNVEAYILPEELKMVKYLSCEELAFILHSGLYDIDKQEHFNSNKGLLEIIRQRVYNVLGLFTSIEGAFSELQDSRSVRDAFLAYIGPMELRHLGKVIRLVIIPMVKSCPCEFWKLWMVDLLGPILRECEYRLHFGWVGLMYHGRADKPYFYGNLVGSDVQIKELEQKLLLEFTREVSDLLGVLALTELNMEAASSSLLRFILLHDCFGKMRMSLFGYFVDDQTTTKVIPFCRSLICFSIHDVRVRHLIMNDLLPCLIQRLDDQLPCAIQRLRHKLGSSTAASPNKNLEAFCEECYNHFEKDFAGESKDLACAENNFTAWLTKQKKDLQVKACSAAKEPFEAWNWEFEDEFRRYLPAYMDMLQQVDLITDYEQHGLSKKQSLFQKLKPEFRSKYGINSCAHPYMFTIFSLWQTKLSMANVTFNRSQGKFISELIKLKPYIKASDSSSSIVDHLEENSEIPADFPDFAVLPSVNFLRGVLFVWEPVFHPLIRKSHMDLLLKTVDQYTKANESERCQQVTPNTRDFEHLEPYADSYFETKLIEKKYYIAIEQIRLHKKFDSHLASGVLDDRIDEFSSSKDDFVKDLVQNELARMQLSDLHHELIKLSLERREELVKIYRQVITYSECLRSLLTNESLKDQLGALMNELGMKGFFDTENDSVDWENKLFSQHVDKFNKEVFAGHRLPKHYVIRGIIDYRSISMRKDCSQQAAFEEVVDEVCDRWIDSCEGFWMETRYYEHFYYDIVRRPLEQVFTTDTMRGY